MYHLDNELTMLTVHHTHNDFIYSKTMYRFHISNYVWDSKKWNYCIKTNLINFINSFIEQNLSMYNYTFYLMCLKCNIRSILKGYTNVNCHVHDNAKKLCCSRTIWLFTNSAYYAAVKIPLFCAIKHWCPGIIGNYLNVFDKS